MAMAYSWKHIFGFSQKTIIKDSNLDVKNYTKFRTAVTSAYCTAVK